MSRPITQVEKRTPEVLVLAQLEESSAAMTSPCASTDYWLTGTLVLQSARAACVDYCAGNAGPLVAYRFDGEPDPMAEHLVWVS